VQLDTMNKPAITRKPKLRVLLPCHDYLFRRIINNMPNGTTYEITGTVMYEGAEWQVCEFYKPIKHEQNTQ
jgi:hypothetical protein